MQKFHIFICLVVLFTTLFAVPVMAQTNPKVTIDLEDLSPDEVAALMALKDAAENGPPASHSDIEKAEEWVSFAEKFGVAVASCARELGIAANEFIDTPVGKLAGVLIVWKVIGQDWWSIIGGSFAWIIIMIILWRSFSHFHMSKKVVLRDAPRWKGGNVTSVDFVRRYKFDGGDAETGSAWAHGVGFAVITIVCMMIVF